MDTSAAKYAYADDLALMHTAFSWHETERVLSQDMASLSAYLIKWRLKLSETKTVSTAFHLNNKEANRELNIIINGSRLKHEPSPFYLGVKLDRSLTYRRHLENVRMKITARNRLIRRLTGTQWGADAPTLRTAALALVFAPAEYCAPVWCRSAHTHLVDTCLNEAMRTVSGCLRPTPVEYLPILAGIQPLSFAALEQLSRSPTGP